MEGEKIQISKTKILKEQEKSQMITYQRLSNVKLGGKQSKEK